MEKMELITAAGLWLEMRDVRNRIVHDYLPEKLKALYDDILGAFGAELLGFRDKISTYKID